MRTAAGTLSLSLAGVPAPTSVTAHGNRVTLTRPGIREWYAAGPLGIEQGFTLAHRPTGADRAASHARADGQRLPARPGGRVRRELRGRARRDRRAIRRPDRGRCAGRRLPSALRGRGRPGAHRGQRPRRALPDHGRPAGPAGRQARAQIRALRREPVRGQHRPVRGRQHGADWGSWRQLQRGRGVGLHPLGSACGASRGEDRSDRRKQRAGKFGTSVALSSDGTTALIGGEMDSGTSALRGRSPARGRAGQNRGEAVGRRFGECRNSGIASRCQRDGNTALVGEPGANAGAGRWWAFIRLGSMWMSQGGGMTAGNGAAGSSVALSSDGNTALIGSPTVGNGGSASVFTRSNGTWNLQTTTPLTGARQSASAMFGAAVALSSDGNTALVGGPADANAVGGAAWVFTRTNGAWSPQGGKLRAHERERERNGVRRAAWPYPPTATSR